ncbi:glycosyltransferase family 1 protein [Arthrobacter crusticola]|uniref:Glycosyltransferase family 1 protein n=1 Tax=Arthrobacter crusticola TaxID=2547960 RepID=A0A4R5TQB0_9MICC|nr:glycosyltransferase family 1 protein [Arthrobacter crusticola]TDK23545.1 glycosyltransferase family 1 protein [Arthrobacter crusticola]
MSDVVVEAESNEGVQPSRPRILVLSFSPIIRDPRVLRQISLLKPSADIISCGYGEAPDGVVEHIRIPAALKPWRSDHKKVAALLAARFHERLYFDSDRVKFVRDRIPVGSIDVVMANDVIAVPLALALRPTRGVHADLHEYAPRQGEDQLQWRLLVGPLMKWACRKYVTRANSVSTVAKGIAEEYARVYGIAEPAVVPNASAYDPRFEPTQVASPLRIVHAGAAGRGRRIEIMMDAVAKANEVRPGAATFDVVLVPGDQSYIDELTRKAKGIPGNAVKVIPPVAFDQIVPLLHGYDIGFYLCPPNNFNMRHALPNKLFEFVQARLAVVIGPSPEMQRIVTEHQFGLVTDGFDAASAADLLLKLTPEEVAEMKNASHTAAKTLSAEAVTQPWLDAVQRLTRVA